MYRLIVKPIFFLFSPEKAHYYAMGLLSFGLRIPGISVLIKARYKYNDAKLEREFCGIKFSNPVGIGAGFDKNARFIKQLYHLGFGYVEVGTVTPKPQGGNPKPRLFRLKKDEALINRMGFNNYGVDQMVNELKKIDRSKIKMIIGGNIGKNKVTPNERAVDDYLICFQKLFPYVDYFVVNVSSPNTPNLRELQEKEPLKALLSAVMRLNYTHAPPKPVLLKIAPDLTETQLDDIIAIVKSTGIHGIVATNTTISREGLRTSEKRINKIGAGGLSGKPVKKISTDVIKYIHQKSSGSIPVMGVGGIHSPEDAVEKIKAGAPLVQLYTGFIYEGPYIAKRIKKYLSAHNV